MQSYLFPPPPLLTSILQQYTLSYPTPFRPYPLLPIPNLPLCPLYSPNPNLHTLIPHHSTLPTYVYPLLCLPTSISTHVQITALHHTLPYALLPPLPTILTPPKAYYNQPTLPTLTSTPSTSIYVHITVLETKTLFYT